jgi:hypothetical protein
MVPKLLLIKRASIRYEKYGSAKAKLPPGRSCRYTKFLTLANSMDTLHNDVGYETTTEEDGSFEPSSSDNTSTDDGTELEIDGEDVEDALDGKLTCIISR